MNEITKTIIDQMGGGNKIIAMTGGRILTDDNNNAIHIHYKMCRKSNRVIVKYDYASDLYDMEFFQYSKTKYTCKKISEYKGIYFDMLKSIFEDETGLYLSL